MTKNAAERELIPSVGRPNARLLTGLSLSVCNNISLIAGQSGSTQWVKHPSEAVVAAGLGVPVEGDDDPIWGRPKIL